MMTVKQFRLFLTLSWVLLVATIIMFIWTEQYLPPPLQEYLNQQLEDQAGIMESFLLMTIAVILGLAIIISYVGLYFWKNWARPLFLISLVAGYLLSPLDTAPVVMPAWSYYLGDLATLFTGMVLAIIYYNENIRQHFTTIGLPA